MATEKTQPDTTWRTRVRAALATATSTPDDGVVEELAQHAQAAYDTARADGCSPQEAEQRVAILLERWRSEAPALHHRSRRRPVVDPPPAPTPSVFTGLGRDIRYAARLLYRQPRYASIAILTMALGIGVTTLLFSITYGVLMAPLPWTDSDRIVVVKETRGGHAPRFGSLSNAAYFAWKEQASTIESLAAWSQTIVTMS